MTQSKQAKKSFVQLVKDYLDEIEKFRTSDPDKYLECLKMLREDIDEGLSKFSQKEIEEARQLMKNGEA